MLRLVIIDGNDVSSKGVVSVLVNDHRFKGANIMTPSAAAYNDALCRGDVVIADPFDSRGDIASSVIWQVLQKCVVNHIDVIIYTEAWSSAAVLSAVQAGFKGYLRKSKTSGERLAHALSIVQSHSLTVIESDIHNLLAGKAAEAIVAIAITNNELLLSPREHEILQALAESHSDKEIAASLGISVSTVETHVSNILRKLDATNRFDCAMKAIRFGLVRP